MASLNKASKLRNNIAERMDAITPGNGNAKDEYDDDYYIREGIEPPRFAIYRKWRIDNCTDEWRKQTLMAVYDSITNDELNFSLKCKLRKTPEQRYQERKHEGWEWHDSNMGPEFNSFTGCNSLQCVPSCRYYPEHGRIEDSEVIEEHKEYVESYARKNAIIDIDLP